jgi:hypothetical protein
MTPIRLVPGVLTVLALILPNPIPAAAAGTGTWEFGMDAGFNIAYVDDEDDSILSVGLPSSEFGSLLQGIRAARFLTPEIQIETTVGFSYTGNGGYSLWRLGIGMDGIYNLVADEEPGSTRPVPFFRAGGVINVYGQEQYSESQLGLGAGAGVRFPLGGRFALRVEAGGARHFETNEIQGHWDVTGSVGLSVFSR